MGLFIILLLDILLLDELPEFVCELRDPIPDWKKGLPTLHRTEHLRCTPEHVLCGFVVSRLLVNQRLHHTLERESESLNVVIHIFPLPKDVDDLKPLTHVVLLFLPPTHLLHKKCNGEHPVYIN